MTLARRATWASALAFALLWGAPQRSRGAPGASDARTKPADVEREVAEAIDELRLEDAEAALARFARDEPGLLYERARLLFHTGDYTAAVELGSRATALAPAKRARRWKAMLDLMRASEETTRGYEQLASPDGRYLVLFPPGKDRVFAEYAMDVLIAADRALTAAFETTLPGPIRLEIYPSPETLAEVSALTEEQVRATGTVALSKWNRLMITSPKALVRGYSWADTIGHELTHMMLSRVTGENAPVWLQEGTAKLFERAWRADDPAPRVDPGSLALLHRAAARGKLLTFDQMHPSIAMLPTEDDAALAFAEVATFITRYVERHGKPTLRAAFSLIATGADAREALAEAADTTFAALEADWKRSLGKATSPDAPRRLKQRFRDADEDDRDESEDVGVEEARRFLRLGDLLWDRSRFTGAAVEYRKAFAADRDDPIVAARFGRAALRSGDSRSAIEALEPLVARFPTHAPTHAVLGAARLRAGDRGGATTALREAIRINPFDPDPHCDLADASAEAREVERERRACGELR
jgi:tetratricopeptide (TPR) repeat protein